MRQWLQFKNQKTIISIINKLNIHNSIIFYSNHYQFHLKKFTYVILV